ncbi:MAG: LytTR family DNA-binding domain-containing protein [Bacteroidota bacterium]
MGLDLIYLLEKFPDLPFEVIFTTAYDQYALRAIKFCALDYLLKPIQIEELIEAVRKAREQISSQKLSNGFQYLLENLRQPNTRKHKLALPTMEGFEFVSIDRIVRCQGDEGYTILIINDGSRIITTRRLRELEELLVDHDFFRIHRSHLINLSFLQKYHKGSGGYVIMSDGTNVDVSRRKKDEFIRRLDEL